MPAATQLLPDSVYSGQPAGFLNLVIPGRPTTTGGVIALELPVYSQWIGTLTDQQVFGCRADATPTGDIYLDVEGIGEKPVYSGTTIADGAITEGDFVQFAYDAALAPDGGFHLLNWSRPGGGTAISLTTDGTFGPASLAGGVLNIPVYEGVGEILFVEDANPVTVLADDGVIVLNKLAPSNTTINLPDVALRNGLPLTIVDFNGNGGEITVNPNGAQTIMSLASATLISNGAGVGTAPVLNLTPNVALNGWYQT